MKRLRIYKAREWLEKFRFPEERRFYSTGPEIAALCGSENPSGPKPKRKYTKHPGMVYGRPKGWKPKRRRKGKR